MQDDIGWAGVGYDRVIIGFKGNDDIGAMRHNCAGSDGVGRDRTRMAYYSPVGGCKWLNFIRCCGKYSTGLGFFEHTSRQ